MERNIQWFCLFHGENFLNYYYCVSWTTPRWLETWIGTAPIRLFLSTWPIVDPNFFLLLVWLIHDYGNIKPFRIYFWFQNDNKMNRDKEIFRSTSVMLMVFFRFNFIWGGLNFWICLIITIQTMMMMVITIFVFLCSS